MKEREKISHQIKMATNGLNQKFTAPVLLSLTLAIAGCQQPTRHEMFRDSIHKNPPYAANIEQISAGKSVEQRDINYTVHGDGEDVTLVIAGIHGDERSGVAVAQKLNSYLAERPYNVIGRTVIIVPIANPDGYQKNTRFNARNVDINRNFATFNRINNQANGHRALTEPESIALAKIIFTYKPSKIITFHSTLNCIDYDGPAEIMANRVGKMCSLPVKKLGSRPGSLGSYAGFEQAIPMITFEFTEEDEKLSIDQLWPKYENAIFAGIYYEQKQNTPEEEQNAADGTNNTGMWESDIRQDDGIGQYH